MTELGVSLEAGRARPRPPRGARIGPAWALPASMLAIVILGAVATPDFLVADNIKAILRNAAITGIVAVCMTSVTVSGNFVSLATQQTAMLAAVLFAAMLGAGVPLAVALAGVVGAMLVVGVVQGAVVGAGLNPVLTTLAAGSTITGGVFGVTDGRILETGERQIGWLGGGTVAGVPSEVITFALVTFAVVVLMDRSRLGRCMTLCGANRAAARLSGIDERAVTTWAFTILSLGTGLAGVMAASKFGSVDAEFLDTLTLDVIAAVLVGGIAVGGGHGSPARAAAGAIVIAMLNSILVLHDVSSGARQLIDGALIVTLVVLMHLAGRLGRA